MQSLCFFWRDIFYQISQTALQHIAQAFYQKMGCAEAEVWDPDGVARTVNQNWKTTFELGWMPGTYSAKNKAGETIMTVERDQENVKIGEKRGEEKMLMLMERLIEDKRFDDIARIKADNGYRQKLYLEYHII